MTPLLDTYDHWAWTGTDLAVFLVAVVVGLPLLVLGAAWLSWPEGEPSFWQELRALWRRPR